MKFTYIGDPNDPDDNGGDTTFRGVAFKAGEPTTITDPELQQVLAGHSHFEKVAEARQKKPAAGKRRTAAKRG